MDARKRTISLLLWAVAAVATFWLWHRQRPELAALPGIVEAVPMPLGVSEPGRIATLYVVQGQAVRAGDPLVGLDTTPIDAELAVARGLLAEALAGSSAENITRTRDLEQARIEAAARLAEARAQSEDVEARKAAIGAELRAVRAELKRVRPLVQEGVAGFDRVGDLEAQEARLRQEARHLPQVLASHAKRRERLETLLAAYEAADPGATLAPLDARVDTEKRRVEALLKRKAAATLRAPRDGRVTRILLGPGAAVGAGVPVIEMMPHAAERLVAWLPEATARRIQAGDTVEVAPLDRMAGAPVVGRVEELGPGIIQLPQRLWADINAPKYGRPVHIRLAQADRLLPDERVSVTVREVQPTGALAADVPSSVAPIVVPDALVKRSRVEISGALWLPERARFLVVSDDTGFADRDDDAPWVFTLDAAGRLDPDPLPIDGVKSVSDLEAITRGPDGAIYLLCSQSVNKKGKRKGKRTRLLRTRLEGDRLRVDGAVKLWDLLVDGLGLEERLALGIDDGLDLEGMAWFDGGLLFGLKSPADPAGRARIWHLTDVEKLFGAGLGFDGATLRLWAALSLPVGPSATAGGISELMADGQGLYLLSTPVDGKAGAAWYLPHREAAPERLAAWPDRKPEGLARGPEGLRVFFDEGADPPTWAPLADAR